MPLPYHTPSQVCAVCRSSAWLAASHTGVHCTATLSVTRGPRFKSKPGCEQVLLVCACANFFLQDHRKPLYLITQRLALTRSLTHTHMHTQTHMNTTYCCCTNLITTTGDIRQWSFTSHLPGHSVSFAVIVKTNVDVWATE